MSNYIPYKDVPNYRTVACCKWCIYERNNQCGLYTDIQVEDDKICDSFKESLI